MKKATKRYEAFGSGSDETNILTPGVYYPPKRTVSCSRQKTTRQKCKRAVLKNGEFNIVKFTQKFGIFSDWFIALVEARWRWTLFGFFAAFTCDWLVFGFIYWLIALTHGDLILEHLPPNQNITNWTPCVENIYGFTSTFLFSVEVHTTVAYGKRAITLECPDAILAMCIQCIFSSIFQSFMVGILFAKLTRPKARTQTILFSKNAIVSLRDEKLCMIFRVGDMRKSRILNIKASMFILRLNKDSENIDDTEQVEMRVELDGCESSFFLWPVAVVHVIDSLSPLYNLSAADLFGGKLEILVVFEGVIESTGQPVQARSSYTEVDIIWGHRFVSMVEIDDKNQFFVDFSKLNETEQVDTPLCSSSEYESVISSINNNVCSIDNGDITR
ncbi:G protein-activated inward rectifier potassium channel 4-like [Plodia interpunctella]|uniref:G protein-activated inward rectifier potassium channel 4-like n=1 Tax=Plodia interpunctella TaxID=58824 RepID=UPI002368E8F5|nr:G protein-activated inward rectifier potassium channel 4-like [Plodia interpunctella]XP_053613489.1 G protein-activated inward rectifier potassium channel 4-like [Plodia interpunctella]XP_053613490.1 G protein-activated inward rectifier potassium channel 4-like [Plodia interpunctella]XP_053613491.1 G protein-activated inward rectifier potassium channel 4-like [Plodia interpunctella]XP_053613492.1 G protein-activated inward rectifier potassium channel 4-like [Plodia interpunctella]